MKMKTILSLLLLLGLSKNAFAFACKANGNTIYSGNTDIRVTLDPLVQVGQNIIVRLGNSIQCVNHGPLEYYLDPVRINSANYTGPLSNLAGSISYYGFAYDLPINTPTRTVNHTWLAYQPWDTVLYLKVIGSGASGIAVNAGQMLATLTMEKTDPRTPQFYTWSIYASNSVVVPTGGCDVSSRNITVTLPDYPGTAAVPLDVHCAQNQNLAYYLTGTTTDSANTIFANTSSAAPAGGIGVQLSNRNGIIAANKNIPLGTVGNSPVSLGLTTSYARTSGQVVAGNVQSIIGVTFIYQ